MGIDPLEAGNILGEDDEDDEHKVYLEERIEYIPERRASQMIIDFDPKAKTVINYLFAIYFYDHGCVFTHVQNTLFSKMRYHQADLKLLCYLNIINIYLR